ncbi:MAG TPA: hypothetical protein PKM94_03360 [candidate division Zixibacteria bacterium]|nr:hypothetical protein [candidate division Zixibacteria bacterium]MDD4916313.1 hypothetical protein [candidate division Zixibacteria bacterium]MDM7971829.1 hypothetical protein [candidate division Zixibacteria bacterium]HOD65706.1 hypothetical protein [candidate division Zixibacteria bacterium]HPC10499.1 hypothetical protein [candidate division Zixibacteria bacterium]
MRRPGRAAIGAGLLLACAAGAAAFELPTPRGEGFGRTMLLADASAAALTKAPTAGIRTGEWRFELGGVRRFELSDLDQVFAAAAGRLGRAVLAAGVSQFGNTELYAETTVRLAAGWRVGAFGAGGSLAAKIVEFGGGYGRLHAAAVGLSATYAGKRVQAAAAAENLNCPRLDAAAAPDHRRLDVYVEI